MLLLPATLWLLTAEYVFCQERCPNTSYLANTELVPGELQRIMKSNKNTEEYKKDWDVEWEQLSQHVMRYVSTNGVK